MAILSRGGNDDDATRSKEAAGGPPLPDVDFDPNDPEQVKVHYNLTGWTFDQRAELAESLAERAIPHAWDGEELVVPEQVEAIVDDLFDELERELGPFPVPLLDDGDDEGGITSFGLDEWPERDIELLQTSLVEAEIPHRWEGRTLVVPADAEHTVDDLLDAIEAGEVASLDEDAEAPDGALQSLYRIGDRLGRDTTDAKSRTELLELVPRLRPTAAPFGLPIRSWDVIVNSARTLVGHFDDGAEPVAVAQAADELKAVCRPFV